MTADRFESTLRLFSDDALQELIDDPKGIVESPTSILYWRAVTALAARGEGWLLNSPDETEWLSNFLGQSDDLAGNESRLWIRAFHVIDGQMYASNGYMIGIVHDVDAADGAYVYAYDRFYRVRTPDVSYPPLLLGVTDQDFHQFPSVISSMTLGEKNTKLFKFTHGTIISLPAFALATTGPFNSRIKFYESITPGVLRLDFETGEKTAYIRGFSKEV